MSDLIKTLKQIALRKRDEKGEQGKRVSEKGFIEWKAADALEAKDNRIAELEADRLCRCVDEVRCELQAEVERLTATQKYLCDCLEAVGIDSSAALQAEGRDDE